MVAGWLWCAVLLPFSRIRVAANVTAVVVVALSSFRLFFVRFSAQWLRFVRSLTRSFDSVFGSQNINKTFSTVARLNGSAFIFIFVYRFRSLARILLYNCWWWCCCCINPFSTGARIQQQKINTNRFVGMRLKPKQPRWSTTTM